MGSATSGILRKRELGVASRQDEASGTKLRVQPAWRNDAFSIKDAIMEEVFSESQGARGALQSPRLVNAFACGSDVHVALWTGGKISIHL